MRSVAILMRRTSDVRGLSADTAGGDQGPAYIDHTSQIETRSWRGGVRERVRDVSWTVRTSCHFARLTVRVKAFRTNPRRHFDVHAPPGRRGFHARPARSILRTANPPSS